MGELLTDHPQQNGIDTDNTLLYKIAARLFGLGGVGVSMGPATPVGTPTDRSGTIASGGVAQQVAAANAARRWFLFQNNSDTDCWINFGVTAVANQPSIKIVAGQSYENPPQFCPVGLISVIGATTGKTFTCKEA